MSANDGKARRETLDKLVREQLRPLLLPGAFLGWIIGGFVVVLGLRGLEAGTWPSVNLAMAWWVLPLAALVVLRGNAPTKRYRIVSRQTELVMIGVWGALSLAGAIYSMSTKNAGMASVLGWTTALWIGFLVANIRTPARPR